MVEGKMMPVFMAQAACHGFYGVTAVAAVKGDYSGGTVECKIQILRQGRVIQAE